MTNFSVTNLGNQNSIKYIVTTSTFNYFTSTILTLSISRCVYKKCNQIIVKYSLLFINGSAKASLKIYNYFLFKVLLIIELFLTGLGFNKEDEKYNTKGRFV